MLNIKEPDLFLVERDDPPLGELTRRLRCSSNSEGARQDPLHRLLARARERGGKSRTRPVASAIRDRTFTPDEYPRLWELVNRTNNGQYVSHMPNQRRPARSHWSPSCRTRGNGQDT